MQARYAIINTVTNEVDNVVVWDPQTSNWQPPTGQYLVMVDDGWGFGPGDLYDPVTGTFERYVSPAETEPAP